MTQGQVMQEISDEQVLYLADQRDGFMSRKAHRRGAVLAIGTGVGQRVQVDSLHDAILRGTQPACISISWRGEEAV